MIVEWASIYIMYDASINLFEKALRWHVVPVSNHLMDTESDFALWGPIASPTQTWIALWKLVDTYNFAASPFLHYMISTQVAVPKLWFLHSNGPNNKHSSEEHMWHVVSTTSAVQQWRPCKWQD